MFDLVEPLLEHTQYVLEENKECHPAFFFKAVKVKNANVSAFPYIDLKFWCLLILVWPY